MNDSFNHFGQQLHQNNRQLFNQLFADYYVNLCRFAYTYVSDNDIAEEIVQEVFIALRKLRQKLSPYFTSIIALL